MAFVVSMNLRFDDSNKMSAIESLSVILHDIKNISFETMGDAGIFLLN